MYKVVQNKVCEPCEKAIDESYKQKKTVKLMISFFSISSSMFANNMSHYANSVEAAKTGYPFMRWEMSWAHLM